jgi:hypothetical protein
MLRQPKGLSGKCLFAKMSVGQMFFGQKRGMNLEHGEIAVH